MVVHALHHKNDCYKWRWALLHRAVPERAFRSIATGVWIPVGGYYSDFYLGRAMIRATTALIEPHTIASEPPHNYGIGPTTALH